MADAAGDYTGATAPPPGWEYLVSSDGSGGAENALAPNQTVGELDNTGFGGAGSVGSASILGSGSPFGLYNNFGHSGVAGTDLLFQPGNGTTDDFIIARYTVSAADVASGTVATIAGSFRDMQGGTTGNGGNSVAVSIYHNTTSLFSATGSAGRLYANGSSPSGIFNLTDVTLTAGDTISFVVGNNGHFGGDETALQATIEVSGSAPSVADDFFNVVTSSTTDLDVLANDLGTSGLNLATLQVTTAPSLGTANVQPDDTIRYVHGGTEGPDSFEYSVDNLAGNTTYTGVVDILANNGLKTANSTLAFSDQPPSGGFQFSEGQSAVSKVFS